MGRYTGPSCRLCRAEKTKLFLKGSRCYTDKCPITKRRNTPGKPQRARTPKMSDYAVQLREKQKLKRIYGMLEKQFTIFFDRAEKMPGKTGDNLVGLLETRLDNIIYRMRFASSRSQARQLILHGHVFVNGRKVRIPSFMVKQDDEVSLAEESKKLTTVKDSLKEYTRSGVMPWLEVDPDRVWGKLRAKPQRNDVTDLGHVKEQLIVELYSK